MKLQDRLHKIAEYAVSRGLTSRRHQWSDMAKAAGCTPANMRNAARGEQTKMDEDLLKKLAKWAGVRAEFTCAGVGPMIDGVGTGGSASYSDQVRSTVDQAAAASAAIGWSREATILAMLLERISDDGRRQQAFSEASAILVRLG